MRHGVNLHLKKASLHIMAAYVFGGAASCTSAPVLPTMRPIDANRYESVFRVDCNGGDKLSYGTNFCQYKEKDSMHFRIKTPESDGEIQVRSCRHGHSYDINKYVSWQDINWVQYSREDSCPIVFSITTRDAGIQLGKIYPYVSNEQYPALNAQGSYYCWQSEQMEKIDGQSSCQFPTGTTVDGYLNFNPEKSGQYLIVSKDCNLNTGAQKFSAGQAPIKWIVQSSAQQYCPVSAAIKYDDGSIEEYEVYLDFFNNGYALLPPPYMGEHKAQSFACAPQDFAFFDMNDHRTKRGLFRHKCIKNGWFGGNTSIGVAWDRAGRSSYSIYLKGTKRSDR